MKIIMNDLNVSKPTMCIRHSSIQKKADNRWHGNMHRKIVWFHLFSLKEYQYTLLPVLFPLPLELRINWNTNIKIKSETLPKYPIKENKLSRISNTMTRN